MCPNGSDIQRNRRLKVLSLNLNSDWEIEVSHMNNGTKPRKEMCIPEAQVSCQVGHTPRVLPHVDTQGVVHP